MSHQELHADAALALGRWRPVTAGERALREAFLGFLDARADATRRSCEPGHLTASAVVLDPARTSVLLTLHPRVGRWVQLGGHCEEDDRTLAGAALREATEESGIAGLTIGATPIHLDVHPITCSLGLPTRHFDVRFLVTAPPEAVPLISAESSDLRFWPLDGLPGLVDESLLAALGAAAQVGSAARAVAQPGTAAAHVGSAARAVAQPGTAAGQGVSAAGAVAQPGAATGPPGAVTGRGAAG